MFRKIVVVASAISFLSMPAFAATEYWVAKNGNTKKCEVVSHKPDGKKLMEIGKTSYKTSSSAEKAMKTAADCK